MKMLENYMVCEQPKYREWSEIESYENYLLEQQDLKWEEKLDE